MSPESAPFQILPRDLSAYRQGNTGIDYVHRFESGRPGPHVLINALTHGNEFCGMVAAAHLLDTGVRPRIGTLTVSFANVGAYDSFDPSEPFKSRQLVHNLNRIWSEEDFAGLPDSPEQHRARDLRPAIAAADHILDIHSTSQDVPPFWVYPAFERNAAVALAIGLPDVHLVMPGGLGSGTPLIQHGRHGRPDGHGTAMVVECGQHFLQSSADLATGVALEFLVHFGLIEPAGPRHAARPQRRFELLETHVIKTPQFRFSMPVIGFEVFRKGELIYTDGALEVRAPVDDCTLFMPSREATVGKEAVYLTRPIA
ncbi:MAG: succinylglutamate desuccinylase/aspartoacylase family protein [Ramlibacter sp.]|nr:succinylglutamate desuccinylase/aspartoacylase family protein [Ramlibacter sp.]